MIRFERMILIKSLSWRFIGSLDTYIISLIITNKSILANQIVISDFFLKIILFYFFEKYWINKEIKNSTVNLFGKSFLWRIIATLATFLLVTIISGEPIFGLKISIIELFTKLVLFVLHDKLWIRFLKRT